MCVCVGGELVDQIQRQQLKLSEKGIVIRVCGLASSPVSWYFPITPPPSPSAPTPPPPPPPSPSPCLPPPPLPLPAHSSFSYVLMCLLKIAVFQ